MQEVAADTVLPNNTRFLLFRPRKAGASGGFSLVLSMTLWYFSWDSVFLKQPLVFYSFRPPAFGGGSRSLLGGLTCWGHPASLQQGWDGASGPVVLFCSSGFLATQAKSCRPVMHDAPTCAEPVRVALAMQISSWMKTRGISPWHSMGC